MDNGTYAQHPQLDALPSLVQKQRRTTAAQLRITREDKDLRDQMRQLLDEAKADIVTCNGYEVRACQGRDGRATVRVSPLPERQP